MPIRYITDLGLTYEKMKKDINAAESDGVNSDEDQNTSNYCDSRLDESMGLGYNLVDILDD